ncbi:phosphoglucosamine mutase [Candidatus Providencia siddallii]|uniref:Phosphoglucosamine mutase n=1 Tax=Candidatus Providencia siddallii TaxID=1715285 RepID=A0ABP1CE55_9GAMM
MYSRKFFGTDGIRGKVGKKPITPEFILKLGWAAGKLLTKHGSRKIIIGKDTRFSCYMLETSLEAGLLSAGVSTIFTGIIPTPAIAYLTRVLNVDAGIVISASHNPYYDNGIKFFSVNGTKLPDKIEKAIELEMEKQITCVESSELGRSDHITDATGRYIEFCKSTFSNKLNLSNLKLVIDCANGATYNIAPNVFRELGAEVVTINCEPNGFNINKTTDISLLQQKVLEEKANVGLSFDGDGDRVIMVDHLCKKIDGDQIAYIIIRESLRQNKLKGGMVGTLMSNIGLEIALKKLGIPFERSKVGDRYIFKKLQEKKWRIGAENSGHVILLDKTTTGDGIIAGLQVLNAIVKNNTSLNELCNEIKLLPQILVNVNFKGKNNPLKNNSIITTCIKIEKEFNGKGRVLLRKSGTEPVIRIMVEGENKSVISALAYRIANMIENFI